MKNRSKTAALITAVYAGSVVAAQAQDVGSEIDDLKARIAALEAQQLEAEPTAARTPLFQRIEAGDDTDVEVASASKTDDFLDLGNNLRFNLTSGTEITLYGFARAEAFYDFDFQQGDLTRVGRIGEPEFETDGAFDTSVRVSRFGIRSSTQTGIGDVGTQLEFDLFGSGGDDSGSPNLRLRHANVTINDNWLFGQFWTNFMPLVHYPRTADFNGPVGITFARQPQVRYTNTAGDLQYSFSIEESNGSSDDPVLTAAALYSGTSWSVRGAALAGRADSDVEGETVSTSAFTLSGGLQPWEGGSFTATYVDGDGIGAYLIGGGAEAVGGGANGATGVTLEFRQQVAPKLNLGIAYGLEEYDNPTATTTLDFVEFETVHLNAFYQPVDNLTFGLEYIIGERTTSTGQTFDADRIGASVTMSF